jgi:hypothetical protein
MRLLSVSLSHIKTLNDLNAFQKVILTAGSGLVAITGINNI